MGNELTTDKRGAMLNSMKPATEQLDSASLKKHKSLISFELEVVSTKLDRFGWGQMSSTMKDRLTSDWLNVLGDYKLDEVKAACSALMLSRPKDATNEQQVKAVILTSRSKALAAIPKQSEPDTNGDEPTQESKDRVQAMVKQFSADHKI